MKTYRRSPLRNLMTFLVVILTLTMLFLATVYIGGIQSSNGGSAISLDKMSEGNVSVGSSYTESLPIYEKGLLKVSYAAIIFGGRGGGAHGSEAPAGNILDFATKPIHTALSSGASFEKIGENEFLAATYGDYIFIDFISSLPYQMLYALTGEYAMAARSEDAINADRIILSFPESNKAKLFLSDGSSFYTSDTLCEIRYTEALALAGDSRLSPFTVKPHGVPVSNAGLMLSPISASTSLSLSGEELGRLYSIFGFDYDRARSPEAVAPHGTLQITPSFLAFSAAAEGGILISNLLPSPKDALDITIYDILLGSTALAESIADASGGLLGEASFFLKGFCRESDTYTVLLGAAIDSVEIIGGEYPYFAQISVQNGRFKEVKVHLASFGKNGLSAPVFHSLWQYSHASESADIYTLRLKYNLPQIPAEELSPVWYFTGSKHNGGEKS